ncbi:MAG: hypothetical protein O3C63_05630 [Cyanobacteria bacterium]|nr:hypothetical protein [Cyanobacteriota bacterium]MDA1020191.1 hypothetical protein [Cyanobacteriota bacterium]
MDTIVPTERPAPQGQVLNNIYTMPTSRHGIDFDVDQKQDPRELMAEIAGILQGNRPDPKANFSTWDKVRDKFFNGPDWFQNFRNQFTISLNSFGILFNTIAVIASNSTFFSKSTTEFLDKKSEWFSKYIIPISFSWSGIESLMKNRLVEAAARIIPASLFTVLPFYNLNMATGVSSALNYLFEHVMDRHGGKHPGKDNMLNNAKAVLKSSADVFKDIFTLNSSKESIAKQLGTLFMSVGSLGGLAFAHDKRDSMLARIFGNLRNIGGLIADWKLIFNDVKNDDRRTFDLRFVGSLCSTASILNILMRWVDPKLARSLNHIGIALDDLGLTYWANQSSKRDKPPAKFLANSLAA